MKKTKANSEKREMIFNRLSLFAMGIIGSLVGVILILVSKNIESYEDIFSMIGQTIIAISFSSLLLEWFGYVNYTRKRMCEILAEDEVIKILDMKRKKELKSALIKNIYMPNNDLQENNIATIVDDEMDKILQGYYYDEYILYIDVSIIDGKDGKKYIKKDIRNTFTARSVKGDKCTIRRLISTYLEPPTDLEWEPIVIKNLIINSKEITEIRDYAVPPCENNGELKESYSKHFLLDNNNKFLKGKLTFRESIDIDITYTSIVMIDDLIFSHQIDRACKHYCIHYNLNSEDYDIIMEGFGFMSLGNTKRQRTIKTNNGNMLRFLDWILPGDGVMVVLKEKHKNI